MNRGRLFVSFAAKGMSLMLLAPLLPVRVTAVQEKSTPADDWFISAADNSAITKRTSRAQLERQFGRSNVVEGEVPLGEGESEPGTILFPSDPKRRLEILWENPRTKDAPASIRCTGEESLWHTVHRISLGTSLRELERLNGKPFRLSGFGWDYSGTLISWDGGKLEKDMPGVWLRLAPRRQSVRERDQSSVEGDREFTSRHLEMQRLNPKVYFLLVEFK